MELTKIEYVATMSDLQELFGRLPDPDKFPKERCKVKVQMGTKENYGLLPFPNGMGKVIRTEFRDFCEIEFIKMNENGKIIWIYEGKVKA